VEMLLERSDSSTQTVSIIEEVKFNFPYSDIPNIAAFSTNI
jgi:hypothetical protein